jgi:hypothetical protein
MRCKGVQQGMKLHLLAEYAPDQPHIVQSFSRMHLCKNS